MDIIVGHGNASHDGAIAVVVGDEVYAEALERHTQCKRAFWQFGSMYSVRALQEAKRKLNLATVSTDDITFVRHWSRERLLEESAARHILFILEVNGPPFLVSVARVLVSERYALRPPDSGKLRVAPDVDHHLAHAANAAYTSPFEEAVVMALDGGGEIDSCAFYHFHDNRWELLSRTPASKGSLGNIYSIVTELCGFSAFRGEEWKVMGLAAYGRPNEAIYGFLRDRMIVDGLDFSSGFTEDLGGFLEVARPFTRAPGDPDFMKAADLAHNLQRAFTDTVLELADNASRLGLSKNLVFGGGCALNSVTNGQLVARTDFERLHVPSAPGDDGNALGAALYQKYAVDGAPWEPGTMSPYLGSTIRADRVDQVLGYGKLAAREFPDDDQLCRETARLLADGRLVGWIQGAAEYGPRALGHRSILADPRAPNMKDELNGKVKFREPFRPLAPAILDEHGPEYFEDYQTNRYMDRALKFREDVRGRVPAVVHVDGTGRLQSVREEWEPLFYRLLKAFHERTGIPLLVNTSYNVMGKPIVHSLEDVLTVFVSTGLDHVVIGRHLISQRVQA